MELDDIIGLLKRYTYTSDDKNSELGEQDAAAAKWKDLNKVSRGKANTLL